MTKPLSLHTLDTAITFSHVSARIMIGTQDLSKSSVFLVSCFYTNVSDSEVLYIQYVFVKYIITINTVFHSCLNNQRNKPSLFVRVDALCTISYVPFPPFCESKSAGQRCGCGCSCGSKVREEVCWICVRYVSVM